MIIADRREPHTYRTRADRVAELVRGDYLILADARDWDYFGEFAASDPQWPNDYREHFPMLVFERKTVSDFWKSLLSNRLNLQLVGLDGLLLEFTYVPRRMDWKRVYDAMNGLAHEAPVFHIRNILHLYETLRRWERQLKDGTYHQVKLKASVVDLTNPQLTVLAQFPGIGEKRAASILAHYKSLGAAISDVSAWPANIDGIGPITSSNVKTFLDTSVSIDTNKGGVQKRL